MKQPSMWRVEPDEVLHQAIGKMVEEAGELASRGARCLIQGVKQTDPKTLRQNWQELLDEMADMEALIRINKEELEKRGIYAGTRPYYDRVHEKFQHKRTWLRMVADAIMREAT